MEIPCYTQWETLSNSIYTDQNLWLKMNHKLLCIVLRFKSKTVCYSLRAGREWKRFTLYQCPWEKPDSVFSFFRFEWKIGCTGLFSLSTATSVWEGIVWIQTNCALPKKLILCHHLLMTESLDKYVHRYNKFGFLVQ